jgi:hypothetical protein
VNAAPTFGVLSFAGNEDGDLFGRVVATDPEGGAVTLGLVSQPGHGALLSLDASGNFQYRPGTNYFGADTFEVRAQDAAGAARNGTVTLTIASINDAPRATDVSIDTDEENPFAGSVNATDADNEALSIAVAYAPASGTLQNLGSDGSFTYVPNRGFYGTDLFRLRISDAADAAIVANVIITVHKTSPEYSGSAGAITISESNAARSARSAWLAIKVASVVADSGPDRDIAAGPVDLTIEGGTAGTLRLAGTLNGAGTGSLTGTFTGFQQDGVTLDGKAFFDILDPRTATSARVEIWPRSLRYRDQHLDATITGRLVRHDTMLDALPKMHLTGDLLAVEASGVQHRFADLSLDATREIVETWSNGINYMRVRAWSGSARSYDSRYGYVDVSTSATLRFLEVADYNGVDFRSDVSRAYPDGSLVATGAGAMRVWLTPLSPAAFSLEVNRTGTSPNVSVAYRWEDDFQASAGADTDRPLLAALAAPALRKFGHNGTVFRPEGRFSENAQGRFLGHQWRLVYAPPGSSAQLDGANTSRPSFTPDVSGDYVLNLVVSEGASTSGDYLLIESVPPQVVAQDRGQQWPASRAVPGGAANTALGEEFVLDGRRTYQDYHHASGFDTPVVWSIWEQQSGQFILTDAPGPVLRFTAPRIGGYQAILHGPNFLTAPQSTLPFAVGLAPRFLPRVRSQLGFRSVDWDGDGDLDSIGSCVVGGLEHLGLMRRNASGRYDASQCLLSAGLPFASSNNQMIFEDISGDGRLDLIWLVGPDVRVAIQQNDGSLSALTMLGDRPCNGSRSATFTATVDVDRNGRPDVVRVVCDGSVSALVFNASNNDGTFGPATVIPTSAGQLPMYAESADIDGDGDREIFAVTSPNAPWQSFTILSLNNGGTFDSTTVPVTFSYTPVQNSLKIADLNGDGRLDLIGGGSHLYVLTQNANGTFTQRARIEFANGFSGHSPPSVGDVNGDGRMDLAFIGKILLQQSDGQFAFLEGFGQGVEELVDVDLDGRADFFQQGIIDLNSPID